MNSSGLTQARYKGPRCRDPLRMTDKYACIDEVIPLPVYELASDADISGNICQTYEPRVKVNLFTPTSPLLNAFFAAYAQFRVRSVHVTFTSVSVDNVNNRYSVGCYWIPNHSIYDSGVDGNITVWNDFMEKDRTSMISRDAGASQFSLRYIPQLSDVEFVEEDEPDIPAVDYPVLSSMKGGWLPTSDVYKDFEFRGPLIVFRKPYSAVPVNSRVWTRQIRCVFEFRQAKTSV